MGVGVWCQHCHQLLNCSTAKLLSCICYRPSMASSFFCTRTYRGYTHFLFAPLPSFIPRCVSTATRAHAIAASSLVHFALYKFIMVFWPRMRAKWILYAKVTLVHMCLLTVAHVLKSLQVRGWGIRQPHPIPPPTADAHATPSLYSLDIQLSTEFYSIYAGPMNEIHGIC